MAQQYTLSAALTAKLSPYLPPLPPPSSHAHALDTLPRPFVTLTYASSLDGALSLGSGLQTRLSGAESMAMTHFLRSRYAAILIGVSTMLADDPGLNCRLAGADMESQPRPIIVDPRLRWTPRRMDKILQRSRHGAGKAPWVLTATPIDQIPVASVELLQEHGGRFLQVTATRADDINATTGGMQFEWEAVMRLLRMEGLRSVMVEGGGQTISSLLSPSCRGLVHSVIVTIAPTWLGRGDGAIVSPARVRDEQGIPQPAARLTDVAWYPCGEDVVLCGKLPST